MNLSFFKSLRFRLLLLVIGAVLPAWGVIVYTAAEQKRIAVVDIQENVFRLAKFSAHEEEQTLQGTRQILAALAAFVKETDENPTACGEFCANLIKQFKRYANIGVVRSDGSVFCSAVPINKSATITDQTWFQRAIASNDLAGGDYHIEPDTGEPVLILSYPLPAAENQPAGVAFAALALKWFNRYIDKIESNLPTGFTILQVDEKAVVLARQPDTGQGPGPSMHHSPIFEQILSLKTGVIEARNDNGQNCIYAFSPVQSSFRKIPTYMVLIVPQDLAFGASNRILRRNLVLLGIAALLAMAVAWWGSELFIIRQLKATMQASKKLAAGEMNARIGSDYGTSELGQLAKTFDEMAGAIEQRQIERQQAEMELQRSQELFRNLSAHLQNVREEERTRIARKIHDDLGQTLTALKIDLSWLDKKVVLAKDIDQLSVRDKLNSMVALINETIETVHHVSEDLRPGILDDFGLCAAIEWQAETFQKRTGIECRIHFSPNEIDLSKEKSTNLFRIVQESLTNVIRHANASEVKINLNQNNGILLLEIADNGKGIDPPALSDPQSYGLIGIKERVYSLGGEVDISGSPHSGTVISVKIDVS